MDQFRQAAIEAGFSNKQIAFLEEHVAAKPHTHEAQDITDFDEAVLEVDSTGGVNDDDDEDEEEGE